jgi:hypothetical protein
MNKKGFTNPQILGAIILILVFLFLFTDIRYRVQEGSLLSNFATEHETTNTIYKTETIHDTVYVKPNLCNLMEVYIIPGHSDDWCIANGGDWRCDSTFAGCTNVDPPAFIDCTGPAFTASTYQCTTVGGTAHCDMQNAYCTY